MIKKLFILIQLIITGLIPITTLAETVHTAPFPTAIINVNQNLQTRGDGYIPIPYKDRFYFINHHTDPTNETFGCVDKNTRNLCSDEWPRQLPDGDSNSALSSSTSMANEEYTITSSGKLYYPVTRFPNNQSSEPPQDWGLGCFDLTNHTECGYKEVSNNPNSRNYPVAVEGPFVIGDKFYLLDLEMKLYCLDLSSGSFVSCGVLDLSLPKNGGLPKYIIDDKSDLSTGHIGGEVVGNKLYLTVMYDNKNEITPKVTSRQKQAMCITESMAPCWSQAETFTYSDGNIGNFSNYIYYDSVGIPVSLCNRGFGPQSCLALSNGSDTSFAHFSFNTAISTKNTNGLGGEVTIANKTYFPSWAGNIIHCYDWNTQTTCAGFTSAGLKSGLDSDIPNPRDYALSVDDAGCMWALGDESQLWSLDPIALVSPCNVGKFSNIVAKSCSSADWMDFEVDGITASDYERLEVRIKDSNGDWIIFDLLDPANSPIRLDAASFRNATSLEYEVEAAFAGGVTEYTTTPVITITDNLPEGSECVPDPDESFDFCCTPWTKNALENSFQIITEPGGGLNANFTFEYQGNATTDTQIDAYVNYLKTIKPTIDNLSVDFELKDHGGGDLPSSDNGTAITGLIQPGIQTVTWPSGAPASNFWDGFPMKVNHWYGIHSKVKIVNNAGVELNILDQECKDPDLFVRIQVISSGFAIAKDSDSRALDRTSIETLDQAIMQISDGKAIVKSIALN